MLPQICLLIKDEIFCATISTCSRCLSFVFVLLWNMATETAISSSLFPFRHAHCTSRDASTGLRLHVSSRDLQRPSSQILFYEGGGSVTIPADVCSRCCCTTILSRCTYRHTLGFTLGLTTSLPSHNLTSFPYNPGPLPHILSFAPIHPSWHRQQSQRRLMSFNLKSFPWQVPSELLPSLAMSILNSLTTPHLQMAVRHRQSISRIPAHAPMAPRFSSP